MKLCTSGGRAENVSWDTDVPYCRPYTRGMNKEMNIHNEERNIEFVVYREGPLDPAFEEVSFSSLEEAEAYKRELVARDGDAWGFGVMERSEFEVYEREQFNLYWGEVEL